MIDFYKNRKIFFIISIVTICVGLLLIIPKGIKVDIQFSGGAILSYSYEGEIDTNVVEQTAREILNREVSVMTTKGANSQTVVIDVAGKQGIGAENQGILLKALNDKLPNNKIAQSDIKTVEPYVGKKAMQKGITAVVLACVLIVFYVTFRFRKIQSLSLGIIGLICLLHDVLIAFVVYIIFGIPLNDSAVAVALTILGYSINDTIVIYDRIRENSSIMKAGTPLEDLVNKSVTQSLTRSLFTAGCTIVAVLSIFVFATVYDITSIKQFSMPLLAGLISGSYSTIFLAAPMWIMWQKRKEKKKAVKA